MICYLRPCGPEETAPSRATQCLVIVKDKPGSTFSHANQRIQSPYLNHLLDQAPMLWATILLLESLQGQLLDN